MTKPSKRVIEKKRAALEKIAAEIATCRVCKMKKVGVAVPGEGNPDADIVFLGEAPGKEEAKTGRPFIGRSGKLLRTLIKEAGLDAEQVFITSPVKYLPKHVTPTPAEIAHGRKHLMEQLNVIQPKFVVLLGRTAYFAMFNELCEIGKLHGTTLERDGIRYMIAYHPAAPLHSPKLRQELYNDFKKLKRLVKTIH
jgi:uracil-DNA glycosylase family 4